VKHPDISKQNKNTFPYSHLFLSRACAQSIEFSHQLLVFLNSANFLIALVVVVFAASFSSSIPITAEIFPRKRLVHAFFETAEVNWSEGRVFFVVDVVVFNFVGFDHLAGNEVIHVVRVHHLLVAFELAVVVVLVVVVVIILVIFIFRALIETVVHSMVALPPVVVLIRIFVRHIRIVVVFNFVAGLQVAPTLIAIIRANFVVLVLNTTLKTHTHKKEAKLSALFKDKTRNGK